MQETGVHNGAFGADKFGFKKLKGVNWNFGAPQLYEHSLRAGDSITFDPRIPHSFKNPSRRNVARTLCIVAPPPK